MIWSKFPKYQKWAAIFKKSSPFIIGGVVIVIGVLIFNASNRGVLVDIQVPEEDVVMGVPFELEVHFANNSRSQLTDINLTLNLPEGLVYLEDGGKVNVVRSLGDISIRGMAKETFTLLPIPSEEDNAYQVRASATYGSGSLSAQFSKGEEKDMEVKEPELEIALGLPEKVFTGQGFDIEAAYSYSRDEAQEGPTLLLKIEGEDNFSIISSNPESLENGGWLLEENDDSVVLAKGVVGASSKDIVTLKGKAVFNFGGEEYVVKEVQAESLLAPSPLTFDISLSDPKPFVFPGELLTYNINYKNNTGADLKDVVIKAQLLGEMYDLGTLSSNGSFHNLSQTLTWTSSQVRQLREIKKGSQGKVSFSVRAKNQFPINSIGDKNFTLTTKATIESPTITQGLATDRTSGSYTLETKVAGILDVDAEGYFRDAPSGVLNKGPFPPEVGQSTQYTIHWVVDNQVVDMKDVIIKARLGEGVSFVKVVDKSNEGSSVSASPTPGGEVAWEVGEVTANSGILSPSAELIFQITVTPPLSALGQYIPLIGVTTASGEDLFSGVGLSSTAPAITTELPDDGSVDLGDGKVVN